jgi:hypothetical protein
MNLFIRPSTSNPSVPLHPFIHPYIHPSADPVFSPYFFRQPSTKIRVEDWISTSIDIHLKQNREKTGLMHSSKIKREKDKEFWYIHLKTNAERLDQ